MSRWTLPLGAVVACLLFTVIGLATRGSVWFLLAGVAFVIAVFMAVVAAVGASRERSVQRAEELQLLREIAGRED